jgi:hypothetical protein
MEKREVGEIYRIALMLLILCGVGGLAFAFGIAWAIGGEASIPQKNQKKPRIVYPKKTELDFEGAQIEGELHNPGEFYFQHRPEDKLYSLVERRKNFHREMLRDAVLSK